MSSIKSTVAALGAFATTALAHGTVSDFLTDGTYNQGFLLDYYYEKASSGSFPDIAAWYAENTDNGFIAPDSYGTSDINCHKNAEPGALTSSVSAGGTVEFQWTTWPHGIGPVLTYVANCNGDCSSADKTKLKWVKIDEGGYDVSTKTWAAQKLIDNNSSWTTTVPSTLASGNYVFRHEIIALQSAGEENGAQNYPQCMNIKITGSGSDSPEGTLGTALYKSDDPGILFDAYGTITDYTIPGPSLYGSSNSSSGSGSSGSASTPATSDMGTGTGTNITTPAASNPAQQPTTFLTSTTSQSPSTPTSGSGGSSDAQSLYGQCGGKNWTGATTCEDGATCKVSNDYYSQCVPA